MVKKATEGQGKLQYDTVRILLIIPIKNQINLFFADVSIFTILIGFKKRFLKFTINPSFLFVLCKYLCV